MILESQHLRWCCSDLYKCLIPLTTQTLWLHIQAPAHHPVITSTRFKACWSIIVCDLLMCCWVSVSQNKEVALFLWNQRLFLSFSTKQVLQMNTGNRRGGNCLSRYDLHPKVDFWLDCMWLEMAGHFLKMEGFLKLALAYFVVVTINAPNCVCCVATWFHHHNDFFFFFL